MAWLPCIKEHVKVMCGLIITIVIIKPVSQLVLEFAQHAFPT